MTRLRDDLDQQRRLNVCLKERKVRLLKLVVGLQLKRIGKKWFHIQGIEFEKVLAEISTNRRDREFLLVIPPLKYWRLIAAVTR